MKIRNKSFKIYVVALVFCALFSVGLKKESVADAASLDYRFLYNAEEKASGSEIEMTSFNARLQVKSKATEDESGGLPASATVTFHRLQSVIPEQ